MDDVGVKTALSELYAVALTLWGEARNQPIEGIVAVGCVIRNRKAAQGWGLKTIVHARAQFSCWSPAGGPADAANFQRVMGMARRLLAGEEIDDPAWQECLWVAEGIRAGYVRDSVKGSRHYCTVELFERAPPPHLKGRTPTLRIQDHVFFAGVP